MRAQHHALFFQPHKKNCELLPERRWHRRLSVRAREHRCALVLSRERGQARDDLVERGEQDGVARVSQRERLREDVHVFRGESKVQPFDNIRERRGDKPRAHEIFDGFDIVTRRAFEFFDLARVRD